MKSKTQISRQLKRKTNPELVRTIELAKKHGNWIKVGAFLSGSTRKFRSINLKELDHGAKEGDTIVVLGKVVGTGDITKRVRVCALSFSQSAREKLKAKKSEIVSIVQEIEKNYIQALRQRAPTKERQIRRAMYREKIYPAPENGH